VALQDSQSFRGIGCREDFSLALGEHFVDKLASVQFVIDDQYLQSGKRDVSVTEYRQCRGRALPVAGIIHGGKRETYDKRSAFALAVAFRSHRSPMEPYKLLHDGQAQAEAAVVSGERRVGLPETVKNVSQELGFDA
jgi:hypothetical protein